MIPPNRDSTIASMRNCSRTWPSSAPTARANTSRTQARGKGNKQSFGLQLALNPSAHHPYTIQTDGNWMAEAYEQRSGVASETKRDREDHGQSWLRGLFTVTSI